MFAYVQFLSSFWFIYLYLLTWQCWRGIKLFIKIIVLPIETINSKKWALTDRNKVNCCLNKDYCLAKASSLYPLDVGPVWWFLVFFSWALHLSNYKKKKYKNTLEKFSGKTFEHWFLKNYKVCKTFYFKEMEINFKFLKNFFYIKK